MDNSSVIKTIRSSAHDTSKLICFSYAGGNASEYFAWQKMLAPNVELAVVNLKGRGARFKEPCVTEMRDVVSEVVESILQSSSTPFSFFGHSLGSLIAFECAHELTLQAEALHPKVLFLSGRKAPHLPLNRAKLYELSDRDLLNKISSLGSLNAQLLDNKELIQLVLPILRADFRLNDDYQYSAKEKLNIPMVLFGGTDDSAASEKDLRAWGDHTCLSTDVNMFEGGHFFIESHVSSIVDIVNQAISRYSSGHLTDQLNASFV